jgi:hypothetical protein
MLAGDLEAVVDRLLHTSQRTVLGQHVLLLRRVQLGWPLECGAVSRRCSDAAVTVEHEHSRELFRRHRVLLAGVVCRIKRSIVKQWRVKSEAAARAAWYLGSSMSSRRPCARARSGCSSTDAVVRQHTPKRATCRGEPFVPHTLAAAHTHTRTLLPGTSVKCSAKTAAGTVLTAPYESTTSQSPGCACLRTNKHEYIGISSFHRANTFISHPPIAFDAQNHTQLLCKPKHAQTSHPPSLQAQNKRHTHILRRSYPLITSSSPSNPLTVTGSKSLIAWYPPRCRYRAILGCTGSPALAETATGEFLIARSACQLVKRSARRRSRAFAPQTATDISPLGAAIGRFRPGGYVEQAGAESQRTRRVGGRRA